MESKESRLTKSSMIRGARSSDIGAREDAWVRMTAAYGPFVFRNVQNAGLQASDIDDVVQEVFFKASTSIDSYHHSEKHGSFRAWLSGITRNTLNDFFRRSNSTPHSMGGEIENMVDDDSSNDETTGTEDWEPIPGRVTAESTIAHKIIDLIKTDFSETSWRCFWRAVVHGESASAIAEDLKMTAAAVRQAKFRVLSRLRDELDAHASKG